MTAIHNALPNPFMPAKPQRKPRKSSSSAKPKGK